MSAVSALRSIFCPSLARCGAPNARNHFRRGPYRNLLKKRRVEGINQIWVADITYIRLPTCFVYLAALLDACSRYCLGWKLSRSIDTTLALDALEMALTSRHIQPGLIHHSDRGVQYASLVNVSACTVCRQLSICRLPAIAPTM